MWHVWEGFGGINLRERDHLEDPGVDERKYYIGSLRSKLVGMEWIDSDSCRAFVKVVMKVWVPWNVDNFLTSWGTISFWRKTTLHEIHCLSFNPYGGMVYSTELWDKQIGNK